MQEKYDAYEVQLVGEFKDHCMVVDNINEGAVEYFWSVYGHCAEEGGVECLEDFGTRLQAIAYAESIKNGCPVWVYGPDIDPLESEVQYED